MGLGIWALLAKKPKTKKILLIVLISVAFLTSNKVVVNELSLMWESEIQPLQSNHPRTALVLGGYAEWDESRNKVQMAEAADRLYEAILLYKSQQIDTFIISGGAATLNKKRKPESVYVRDYLKQMGVPASIILIDSTSKNTWENAVNSKKILDAHSHAAPVLLITSAIHMPRARRTFKKCRVNFVAYPVHFISNPARGYTIGDYLVPSTEALSQFDAIIKECVGLLVYKLSGKA